MLRQIARGQSTQDIAVALGMSAKTVDSHRRNMREKLGLASAADLVRYAVQWASEDDAPARAPRSAPGGAATAGRPAADPFAALHL